MPAFSGTFDWGAGLIWQVGFAAGTIAPGSIGASAPPHVEAALVDTGASRFEPAEPQPAIEAWTYPSIGINAGNRTAVATVDVDGPDAAERVCDAVAAGRAPPPNMHVRRMSSGGIHVQLSGRPRPSWTGRARSRNCYCSTCAGN